MAKSSTVLYHEILEQLEDFTDEQFGAVIRAIIEYDKNGILPTFEDKSILIAFKVLKPSIDRNKEKYEEICEKRKIAGSLGGKQKAENLANASKCYQNLANLADNDNDNDIYILSKKERKENNINIKESACVCEGIESYETIFDDFGVSDVLREELWEFIKHCQINHKTLTNDKLKNIIVRLDCAYKQDESEKVKSVHRAIMGGYFDIKEGKK